jgi:tetratricopeptide (TPR) repeat protein
VDLDSDPDNPERLVAVASSPATIRDALLGGSWRDWGEWRDGRSDIADHGVENLYFAARDACIAGQTDAAIAKYRTVLERAPGFSPAVRALASVLIETGRPGEASEVLDEWAPVDEFSDEMKRSLLAYAFLSASQPGESLRALGIGDAAAVPASLTPAECVLASIAWGEQGELAQAEEWARRATELDPGSPDAWRQRLRVTAMLQDKVAAVMCARALASTACSGKAARLAAEAMIRVGDLSSALDVLEPAHAQFPMDTGIAAALGWVFVATDRDAEAVPLLEAAVAGGDDRPWTFDTYIIALLGSGQYDSAIQKLDSLQNPGGIGMEALWAIGQKAIEAKDCAVAKRVLPLLRAKDELRANRLEASIQRLCP